MIRNERREKARGTGTVVRDSNGALQGGTVDELRTGIGRFRRR